MTALDQILNVADKTMPDYLYLEIFYGSKGFGYLITFLKKRSSLSNHSSLKMCRLEDDAAKFHS